MSNTVGRSGLVLALGLVALLGLGCSGDKPDKKDKDSGSPGGERTGTTGGDDIAAAKPEFTLTAKQFSEEYLKDENAAKAKYAGKVVELTSTLKDIQGGNVEFGVEPSLILEQADKAMVAVAAKMADRTPWRKAAPGQKVRVKGIGEANVPLPFLNRCIITDVSGPAPPSVTAEEIAKVYAEDANKGDEKYFGRHLIVSGEVAEVKPDESKRPLVTLKAPGKVKILCHYGIGAGGLQPGQKIKVLASCVRDLEKGVVNLLNCLPLEADK